MDSQDQQLVRFVDHFDIGGDAVLRSACRHSLEGIVSMQASAPYESVGSEWLIAWKSPRVG